MVIALSSAGTFLANVFSSSGSESIDWEDRTSVVNVRSVASSRYTASVLGTWVGALVVAYRVKVGELVPLLLQVLPLRPGSSCRYYSGGEVLLV